MRFPSPDSRTKEADEAYKTFPQLLQTYANQCENKLKSQRNAVAILRQQENQIISGVERQKKLKRFNRVFNEFEEIKYRMRILQKRRTMNLDEAALR